MKKKEKPSTPSVSSAETNHVGKPAAKKKRKIVPLRPTTSARGSTGPALIWVGLLAIHMPVRVWALAKMRSTRQATDGFPGDGSTAN